MTPEERKQMFNDLFNDLHSVLITLDGIERFDGDDIPLIKSKIHQINERFQKIHEARHADVKQEKE